MTHSETKEQQVARALEYVKARQQEVLVLFDEILNTPLPPDKTYFDILCERLQGATNAETEKK